MWRYLWGHAGIPSPECWTPFLGTSFRPRDRRGSVAWPWNHTLHHRLVFENRPPGTAACNLHQCSDEVLGTCPVHFSGKRPMTCESSWRSVLRVCHTAHFSRAAYGIGVSSGALRFSPNLAGVGNRGWQFPRESSPSDALWIWRHNPEGHEAPGIEAEVVRQKLREGLGVR